MTMRSYKGLCLSQGGWAGGLTCPAWLVGWGAHLPCLVLRLVSVGVGANQCARTQDPDPISCTACEIPQRTHAAHTHTHTHSPLHNTQHPTHPTKQLPSLACLTQQLLQQSTTQQPLAAASRPHACRRAAGCPSPCMAAAVAAGSPSTHLARQ